MLFFYRKLNLEAGGPQVAPKHRQFRCVQMSKMGSFTLVFAQNQFKTSIMAVIFADFKTHAFNHDFVLTGLRTSIEQHKLTCYAIHTIIGTSSNITKAIRANRVQFHR